jgi:hypothetical protein
LNEEEEGSEEELKGSGDLLMDLGQDPNLLEERPSNSTKALNVNHFDDESSSLNGMDSLSPPQITN